MTNNPQNIRRLIHGGEAYLERNGVPNARRNAEWLLAHTLGCRTADLYMESDRVPLRSQVLSYRRLVQRRGAREPLQYIIGSTEFMGLSFVSVPGVFIPRPDTERLVELVEERLGKRGPARVLDLCCGSGVILIALLRRLDGAVGVGVDIDDVAVMLSRKNAGLNGVDGNVEIIQADAVDFLASTTGVFDAIVCNPPYIPTRELSLLATEIRSHEPVGSLDGGADGLDFYRRTVPLLTSRLSPGGIAAFEIGHTQGESVRQLLGDVGFGEVEIHQDYAGHDRVAIASRSAAGVWEPSLG